MPAVSDFRINASLRQLLARHQVDLKELRFGSFRGTVRFGGELRRVDGRWFEGKALAILETIESETRRIPGVHAVFFDLTDLVRDDDGRWLRVSRPRGVASDADVLRTAKILHLPDGTLTPLAPDGDLAPPPPPPNPSDVSAPRRAAP